MHLFMVIRAEPNNIKRLAIVRMVRLCFFATTKAWKRLQFPTSNCVTDCNLSSPSFRIVCLVFQARFSVRLCKRIG